MIHQLKREQQLNCTLEEAWTFFSTPRNLEKLTPDSVGFRITHLDDDDAYEGQVIGYKIKVAPLVELTWLTEITKVVYHESFIDDQRTGPYKVWHHRHTFEENNGGVLMKDCVTYVLPFGPIGELAHVLFVKRQLTHIFDERFRLCAELFNS